jgi:hypothetical protein
VLLSCLPGFCVTCDASCCKPCEQRAVANHWWSNTYISHNECILCVTTFPCCLSVSQIANETYMLMS